MVIPFFRARIGGKPLVKSAFLTVHYARHENCGGSATQVQQWRVAHRYDRQGASPLMDMAVLVLNQNYEPLHICNARRALVLVLGGKAEVLQEESDVHLRTSARAYTMPSVVRMVYLVRRPRPRVKLTRREVFLRDHYTCQYCGRSAHDLTIDHVMPKSRGGSHTWDNLVSACKECNHRKGGHTPDEARMRLRRAPFEPHAGAYYAIQRRLAERPRADWLPFIPGAESLAAAS